MQRQNSKIRFKEEDFEPYEKAEESKDLPVAAPPQVSFIPSPVHEDSEDSEEQSVYQEFLTESAYQQDEMGQACCGPPAEQRPKSERQLKRQASHAGILGGLALKFPAVRKAFKNVRHVYDSLVSSKGLENLPADKLGVALGALGATHLSQDEIRNLFQLSDLDHSAAISFREFLIAVALGYYLRKDLDETKEIAEKGSKFAETLRGFKIIQEAFKKIDKDGGGTLDPKELKDALFEVGSGSTTSKEILEARFRELDFDGSKEIEFREFVYGFAAWVGLSEDEDEEDEDDGLTESNTNSNVHPVDEK